jgi:hypothetical protein
LECWCSEDHSFCLSNTIDDLEVGAFHNAWSCSNLCWQCSSCSHLELGRTACRFVSVTHMQLGPFHEANSVNSMIFDEPKPKFLASKRPLEHQAPRPQLHFAVEHYNEHAIRNASVQADSSRYVPTTTVDIILSYRALQKYMHEFHAGRDHAMCNIQNRSIPVVQPTQLRKLSSKKG